MEGRSSLEEVNSSLEQHGVLSLTLIEIKDDTYYFEYSGDSIESTYKNLTSRLNYYGSDVSKVGINGDNVIWIKKKWSHNTDLDMVIYIDKHLKDYN